MINPAKVVEGINAYTEIMKKEQNFSVSGFINHMEPYFQEAGYRQPKPVSEQKNILIVRDDAAGDFVLFSGVIREIRRIYPKAHITLLGSPRNAGLTVACPYVDNIIINNSNFNPEDFPAGFKTITQVAINLLKYHFDLAFAGRLGIKSFSLLLMYMCGARERIGFTQDRVSPDGKLEKLGWDPLLTMAVPFINKYLNDVDRNFMLLEAMLRLPIENRSIEVWYTNLDLAKVKEMVKPLLNKKKLITLVPSASVAMKSWPVERFVEVARAILEKEKQTGFLVMGGPGDAAAGDAFCKAIGERHALSLAGKTSFTESAAAVGLTQLYLGCDTGLMHIAAAQKLPVLSVNCFPASLPMIYMSVPIRFAPYQVPSVTVFPVEAADDCADSWSYGCKIQNKSHCILGINSGTVLKGYNVLQEQIAKHNLKPVFLK